MNREDLETCFNVIINNSHLIRFHDIFKDALFRDDHFLDNLIDVRTQYNEIIILNRKFLNYNYRISIYYDVERKLPVGTIILDSNAPTTSIGLTSEECFIILKKLFLLYLRILPRIEVPLCIAKEINLEDLK